MVRKIAVIKIEYMILNNKDNDVMTFNYTRGSKN